MAREVTIVCDRCSAIIVAADTAGKARKEGIRDKTMVRRKGEDICRTCADREERPTKMARVQLQRVTSAAAIRAAKQQ